MREQNENGLFRKIPFNLLLGAVLFPVILSAQADTTDPDTTFTIEKVEISEVPEEETDTSSYFLMNEESVSLSPPDTRRLPDSLVNSLRQDKAFWYVDKNWKNPVPDKVTSGNRPFFMQSWFRKLMWAIIIISFIGVVIWYLVISDVGIFRRRQVIVPGEEDLSSTDNIFEINYEREISRAVASENYRLAVRLLFLRLLKDLSEKEWISYKQDRTNLDYLMQARQKSWYSDFFRLTRHYEYAWYGGFEMNQEIYYRLKTDFEKMNAQLTRS